LISEHKPKLKHAA